MIHFFGNIVDLLLPLSKERAAIKHTSLETVRELYNVQSVGNTTALCSYTEPLIRSLIIAAKFQNEARAFSLLGVLLHEWIQQHPPDPKTIWIPISLSPERKKERGYNQVTKILRATNAIEKSQLHINLLTRTRHTTPQTSLPKTQRLENMVDAFAVKGDPRTAPDTPVILIDDVVTSGATMAAAKAALSPHFHTITCIAIAH